MGHVVKVDRECFFDAGSKDRNDAERVARCHGDFLQRRIAEYRKAMHQLNYSLAARATADREGNFTFQASPTRLMEISCGVVMVGALLLFTSELSATAETRAAADDLATTMQANYDVAPGCARSSMRCCPAT
jgi:hypothetical protein